MCVCFAVCRQAFAHKRCLLHVVASDRDDEVQSIAHVRHAGVPSTVASIRDVEVASVVASDREADVQSMVVSALETDVLSVTALDRDAEDPSVTAPNRDSCKVPPVVGCNRIIGVPWLVPDAVPQPPMDIEATFTVDVVLTSKVDVIAHPSWMTWHRIVVPAACTVAFTLHPRQGGTETTTRSIEAHVEIVTTIVVTDSRLDSEKDGRPVDVNVVQRVEVRTAATVVVVDAINGLAATDQVSYDVTWMVYPRVEVVDVPAAAG